MASSPITSRQIDGETMETVTHFIFLGSKVTADGDCSHEIKKKKVLALWKSMNIVKLQDIKLTDRNPLHSYTLTVRRVTIYSLDVLLFLFGTSLLFHVWFCFFLACIQISQEALGANQGYENTEKIL